MKVNRSKYCLNCNTEINSAKYCYNCGQKNSDKKVSIKHILKNFLGDYFTFDSKFFRSLIPLFIKPGHLTREYIDGKRVSYIFPLRLYIFTTFIFFFVIALNTKLDFNKFSSNINIDSLKQTNENQAILSKSYTLEDKISNELNESIMYEVDSLSNKTADVEVVGPGFELSFNDTTINNNAFLKYIINKSKYLSSLGEEGSTVFLKEIVNQIPKIMFLLLPIFALILKLIYIRNKKYYVEHLVFSLHFHTFIFISLLTTIFISNTYFILSLLILILIYLFFSIFNFYNQSIRKSLIKFLILITVYLLVLFPTTALLMFLAFLSI